MSLLSFALLDLQCLCAGQMKELATQTHLQKLAEVDQRMAEMASDHTTALSQVESELSAARVGMASAEGNFRVAQDQLLETQAAQEELLKELENERGVSSMAKLAESLTKQLLVEREIEFSALEKQLADISKELKAKVRQMPHLQPPKPGRPGDDAAIVSWHCCFVNKVVES